MSRGSPDSLRHVAHRRDVIRNQSRDLEQTFLQRLPVHPIDQETDMPVDPAAIRKSLEQLGESLTSGDAARAATFWDFPALVLADQGAKVIMERGEVEAFFRGSIASYRQRGTPTVRPELQRWDRISDGLVAVDVRWRGLDPMDDAVSVDISHYIMRVGDDAVPRIQVAMSRSGDIASTAPLTTKHT